MGVTFKQFKKQNPGGYICVAAEDIPGFAKKGSSLYGDCDDLVVLHYTHLAELGIYTVYLASPAL